jgi:hypothetical protein
VVTQASALAVAALTLLLPSMLYAGTLMTENAFLPVFLTAALLLVLAAGVACGGGDDESEPTRADAELVTVEDLRALAEDADGPVFWAGPRAGLQYELSQTSDGRIYVRYLPPDVEVGDPRAGYLTVGTYPAEDALAATRRLGEKEGSVVQDLLGGGIAAYDEDTPTSVYVAFPGINRQIEIYDPSPKEARLLAFSGSIMPILAEDAPPEQTGEPVAATEEELKEVAAETEHPVYWLGPRSGVTYELTRLPNGQIYIRYLPEGVEVGDRRPEFETVGTYPRPNALAELGKTSPEDAVTFAVPEGGKAYADPDTPTNVHFAFRGGDYEVELFHPSAAEAERLVRAGDVVPIR